MKNRKSNFVLVCALASVGSLGTACQAQPAPGTPGAQAPSGTLAPSAASKPDDDKSPKAQPISGIVEGYNLDPRGMVNGIVLKDGDRATQLNLPPNIAAAITAAAPVGQKVSATGVPEIVVGGRSIFRFVSLTTADGKQYKMPAPGRDDSQVTHVDGTVKQLNYSPRGEVDGVVLDTGDFLHVSPREAAQLNLAVGEKISADGHAHPMLTGHSAMEATKVNGMSIDRPRPQGRPGGGPDDRAGRPDRDGPERADRLLRPDRAQGGARASEMDGPPPMRDGRGPGGRGQGGQQGPRGLRPPPPEGSNRPQRPGPPDGHDGDGPPPPPE